ncbi:TetR/AcrR family transcriptional regulator [Sphingosinicella rhizophila]|uniref:TetR/AcrR family transcriptional regulator n=1 Tax=Sphingosinicella rhizophila TaxID=3050082 RepID=A0ABU3QBR6_9SPHN|nr:TetR/AcrR family transcriptional regulator [Sphingosinicella sp. GR2756]MDT9600722.1 TetR/AcrR family transcriptional regulator [Sphingosinicella sp. GR2756]
MARRNKDMETAATGRAAVAPAGERRNAVVRKPAPPITKRGTRTRDMIKDAAARVLERMGYRAMRLQDIAEEAGINVSLVYHYFSGKADITFEILTELVESPLSSDLQPAPEDPFEAILEANRRVVATYKATPGLIRCLLQLDEEEPKFAELFAKVSLDWNRRVARDMARRAPAAAPHEDLRLMTAYALGGMVDSFLFEAFVDRNPLFAKSFQSDEDIATFLAILWYRALYLADPPRENMGPFTGFSDLRLDPK